MMSLVFLSFCTRLGSWNGSAAGNQREVGVPQTVRVTNIWGTRGGMCVAGVVSSLFWILVLEGCRRTVILRCTLCICMIILCDACSSVGTTTSIRTPSHPSQTPAWLPLLSFFYPFGSGPIYPTPSSGSGHDPTHLLLFFYLFRKRYFYFKKTNL